MATDTRLWLYGQLHLMRAALRELIAAAADRAEAEVDVLMPGYTHLQPAMVRRLLPAGGWQLQAEGSRSLAAGAGSGRHWQPAPSTVHCTLCLGAALPAVACMHACLQQGSAHPIRRLVCPLAPHLCRRCAGATGC